MTEKVKAHSTEFAVLRNEMLKRLSLWAAIGNVGGLVLTGSHFGDSPASALAYILFPSIVSFVVGLLGALTLNLGFANGYADAHEEAVGNLTNRRTGPVLTLILSGAFLAASGFMFGLLYPLWALGHRYVETGAFI